MIHVEGHSGTGCLFCFEGFNTKSDDAVFVLFCVFGIDVSRGSRVIDIVCVRGDCVGSVGASQVSTECKRFPWIGKQVEKVGLIRSECRSELYDRSACS